MNVYGSRPRRLDSRIKISRLVRVRDHFCPLVESWLVILSIIIFSNQDMADVVRFPNSCGLWWVIVIGMSIENRIVGIVRNSGLENCSNMFMFMVG